MVLRGRLLACEIPGGPVRTLAYRYGPGDGFREARYRIDAIAGRALLLTTTEDDQYGAQSQTKQFDLASGHSYDVAGFVHDTGEPPERDSGFTVVAAVLTKGHRSAAALVDPTGATVQIVAYGPRGHRRVLDTGSVPDLPPAALGLSHGILTWSHSGVVHAARIAA